MEMKKVISIAIAFAMLAVSFAMVGTVKAQLWDDDQSTQITVNAIFPKLYWIGFNQSSPGPFPPMPPSAMPAAVVPNADYSFCFEYNYSNWVVGGWQACDFLIQAWYDEGNIDPVTGYPTDPQDDQRTLAFNITCDSAGNAVIADHPTTPTLEITTGPATPILHIDRLGTENDTYRMYIPVHFGPQTRAALGSLATSGYSRTRSIALDSPDTWDFSITVRDTTSSAFNTSWGEFGIQKLVSVAVTGMPTGNAPPGSGVTLAPYSNIVLTSNLPYFVNVSLLTDLRLGGAPSVNDIPASQVSVRNVHPDAVGNSEISASTPLPGIEPARLYVWGVPFTPISAPGNGTVTAGPLMSDYWGSTASTDLEWYVSVPAGRPEGIYWATVIVRIDDA